MNANAAGKVFLNLERFWRFELTVPPNSTFMLPCIVIDFFLNNQIDTLIIQIYSVIKL